MKFLKQYRDGKSEPFEASALEVETTLESASSGNQELSDKMRKALNSGEYTKSNPLQSVSADIWSQGAEC